MLPSESTLKSAGLLIFVGGSLLWKGYQRRRKTRAVSDMARSRIASAPQGLVEVEGFALPHESAALLTSMAGVKAVFQELLIEERVRRGKNNSHWEKVAELL
jgi:hypothetical protein